MESARSTVRDLRRRSRATLLSALYFDGPRSRQELGPLTGLSGGTVSIVTSELIEDGLVVEAGMVGSDGGRPRTLLRVAPGYGRIVGIDVGETGVRLEAFDLAMARLTTVDRPLRSSRPRPAAVADLIAAGLREMADGAGILGVGIGVPGTVERGDPVLVHAPTIGWRAVPLARLLRERGVDPPLYVDNGAAAQGQAEMWFGAGRGARDAVIALVGSGVGAAVITDGASYRGATSSAGEWGHTTIVYNGRLCRCGARGCLEAYVGADGLLARYRQARRGRPVPGADQQEQVAALIATAARSPVAARVLEETAGMLGAGIADLVNLFNPERIVLGGWAGLALGTRLLPAIRTAAAAHALPHAYARTSIELCGLGPDAVAYGAATLPVAALLAAGGGR
jgi:predicted NBD/HSP70 family sugar kinase